AYEEEAEARALARAAHARVGQPDRRHQLAPRELGQHPGVDPVGLAGQRRQPLHLACVGDLHLPAGALELVVDEAAPVIDSIAALTGSACLPTRSPSRDRPSASGGAAPTSTVTPLSSSRWKSRRRRLRSKPTCNIAT